MKTRRPRRRKNNVEAGCRIDHDGRLEYAIRFARCLYQGVQFGAAKCVWFPTPSCGMYMLSCFAGDCEALHLPVVAPDWLEHHGLPPTTARRLCDTAMSQDHI